MSWALRSDGHEIIVENSHLLKSAITEGGDQRECLLFVDGQSLYVRSASVMVNNNLIPSGTLVELVSDDSVAFERQVFLVETRGFAFFEFEVHFFGIGSTLVLWALVIIKLYPARGLDLDSERLISLVAVPLFTILVMTGLGLYLFKTTCWTTKVAAIYLPTFILATSLVLMGSLKSIQRFYDMASDLRTAEVRSVCETRFDARNCISIMNQCSNCISELSPGAQARAFNRILEFRDRQVRRHEDWLYDRTPSGH